jgi:hypothetical protein
MLTLTDEQLEELKPQFYAYLARKRAGKKERKSAKKAVTSRLNGKKGGRPRKKKTD